MQDKNSSWFPNTDNCCRGRMQKALALQLLLFVKFAKDSSYFCFPSQSFLFFSHLMWFGKAYDATWKLRESLQGKDESKFEGVMNLWTDLSLVFGILLGRTLGWCWSSTGAWTIHAPFEDRHRSKKIWAWQIAGLVASILAWKGQSLSHDWQLARVRKKHVSTLGTFWNTFLEFQLLKIRDPVTKITIYIYIYILHTLYIYIQ